MDGRGIDTASADRAADDCLRSRRLHQQPVASVPRKTLPCPSMPVENRTEWGPNLTGVSGWESDF
jgi:hypothetical protein